MISVLCTAFLNILLLHEAAGVPWGGGGGCGCSPCSCGAPPICPPPVICPPRICPPCPPPIPYRPVSSCCSTCACYLRHKRDVSAGNDTTVEINDDPVCNNDQLKMIMEKAIEMDAMKSTFAIKKAADSKLNAEFNVFCAKDDLAHMAHTGSFCQHKKGDIVCYAYRS